MNKKLLIAALALVFVACDNEDSPNGEDANNTNQNKMVSQDVYTESGFTTRAYEAIHRLEMPRLCEDTNHAFVAHFTPDGQLNYAMDYDKAQKASRWTAYQWYTGNTVNKWNRNNWYSGYTFNNYGGNGDPFQPDPVIPTQYQSTLDQHRSNGYDRGHMLGSADRLYSKEANGQTFYLSNMQPQWNSFNAQGIWYNLESYIRNNFNKDSFRDTLYVVKGGTIAEGQIKEVKNGLPVPEYFFMAILCYKQKDQNIMGGYKAIAFWMKHKANTDKNYKDYAISIDELERNTGIDFFCNLPDNIEKQVESTLVPGTWGLR